MKLTKLTILSFLLCLTISIVSAQNAVSRQLISILDTSTLAYSVEIDSLYKINNYERQFSKYLQKQTLEYLDDEILYSLSKKRDSYSRAWLEITILNKLLTIYKEENAGAIDVSERIYDEHKGFHFRQKTIDFYSVLTAFFESKDVAVFERSIIDIEQYKQLKIIIEKYEIIEENGGWDSVYVADYEVHCLGDRNESIKHLRSRLYASGDLTNGAKLSSTIFDKEVAEALVSFQLRHGIDTTGSLDTATTAALNVPVADRLAVLYVNLERWKWLPNDLGDYYVLSNIPTFSTQLFEDDVEIAYHKTVVGKLSRQTPFFADTMTYMDLNPTWTVPPTILKNDIVAKASTSYLSKKNITVIDNQTGEVVPRDSISWAHYKRYRFVQGAGPSNALGEVKFIFPNDYYIFIHDTPTKSHFSLEERAYSSGCMRIENPRDFAYTLLKEDDLYVPELLDSIWVKGETKRIVLDKRPFVYITYFTVLMGENGLPYFYNDIYGYDEEMIKSSLFH